MTVLNPDTLLAHIISQTRGNLEFLVSQNQLAENECRALLEKLKSIEDVSKITGGAQTIAITSSSAPLPLVSTVDTRVTTPLSPPKPSPGTQVLFRARATWGYNEHGQDPRDLPFSPGDIIDVLRETNEDWWEGRCNGRIGLFPSNYVEKTSSLGFPAPSMDAPPALTGEKFTSHIATPNYHPQYSTASPGPGPYVPAPVGPPHSPANPPQAVVVEDHQNPNKPKKPLLHGNLGNTLAHSAVGGVGFGAGSAIGSGLVNSIF